MLSLKGMVCQDIFFKNVILLSEDDPGYLVDTYNFFITLSGVSIAMLAVAITGMALLWKKRR